jgi:signal transduction histidine kinase
MVFKKLFWVLVLRVTLLLANCMVIAGLWGVAGYLYLKGSLVFLLLAQVVWLFRLVNGVNNRIAGYFSQLTAGDFQSARAVPGSAFPGRELSHQMGLVADQLLKLRVEAEQKNQFFGAVMEQVQVGIMAFSNDGKVILANQYVLTLFGLDNLRQLKQFGQIHEGLDRFFLGLRSHSRQSLEVILSGQHEKLSVTCIYYHDRDTTLSLVTLQKISVELDRHEAVTWQKTIRILTHEIINSLSPVVSLSQSLSTLVGQLPDSSGSAIAPKLLQGLGVIDSRTRGLLRFTTQYRELVFMPAPRCLPVKVESVVGEAAVLLAPQFQEVEVSLIHAIDPPDLTIHADHEQVVQVLINLLKNATRALLHVAVRTINIHAFQTFSSVIVEVSDTGCGIEDDLLDQVFIPFFTTSPDGSGIGLSMARQVMLHHGGDISLSSEVGRGTTVRLVFPSTRQGSELPDDTRLPA